MMMQLKSKMAGLFKKTDRKKARVDDFDNICGPPLQTISTTTTTTIISSEMIKETTTAQFSPEPLSQHILKTSSAAVVGGGAAAIPIPKPAFLQLEQTFPQVDSSPSEIKCAFSAMSSSNHHSHNEPSHNDPSHNYPSHNDPSDNEPSNKKPSDNAPDNEQGDAAAASPEPSAETTHDNDTHDNETHADGTTTQCAPPCGDGNDGGVQAQKANLFDKVITNVTIDDLRQRVTVVFKKRALMHKSDYCCLEKLGRGSFGVVDKIKCVTSQKIYALKRINCSKFKGNYYLESAFKEFKCLVLLAGHPNIVTIMDAYKVRLSQDDPNNVEFRYVLEFMPMNLFDFLQTKKSDDSPNVFWKLANDIVQSVLCCHSANIAHRDIKPQNFLIDPVKNVIKLCDFGMACNFSSRKEEVVIDDDKDRVFLTTLVTTRWYRPPELFLGSSKTYNAFKVDVWSIGCVLYELATRQVLFPGQTDFDTLLTICKKIGTPTTYETECRHIHPSLLPKWHGDITIFSTTIPKAIVGLHTLLQNHLIISNPEMRNDIDIIASCLDEQITFNKW